MNLLRVRRSSFAAALTVLACVCFAVAATAQERAPLVWFQGTRLIFDQATATSGDLAVSTRDGGLHRFLDKLGATLSYEPQSRYLVVTAQDRRTIVFTIGDPSYTVAGVRLRAPFAPASEGADAVLPFFALARALYVEPIADGGETVLQPRVGALDVRTEGGRTTVTVRAAMPLLVTTNADTPDRVQLTFVGQGSSLTPQRRTPGTALDGIDVATGGSNRVPSTTLTLSAQAGMIHHVVPGGSPSAYTVVFEPRVPLAQTGPPTPPPLGLATPPGIPAETQPYAAAPSAAPLAPGRATVTDLTLAPAANDALEVRVTLGGATTYEWHRLLDHRWYLDLANATLAGPGRDEHPSFGTVQGVRVRQIGTGDAPVVRIAFTLSGDPQIDVAPSDDGIVITVATTAATLAERIGAGRTGGAQIAGTPQQPAAPPTDGPWKFGAPSGSKIIVIDPGHGGDDAGTAHNDLTEKILTLDIAQRLRTLLTAQGWTVRMTRETDVDPVSADNLARMHADGKPNADDRAYLQTRCDTANTVGARLFISIHINSAPFTGARGTTFYWYKPQDAAFAQALERSVIPLAGTQDDGARHENFYVVRHTTMPAVLIETAFATNPGDVALLRQPSFLQNVAQGIANGVKAFAGNPAANAVTTQQ